MGRDGAVHIAPRYGLAEVRFSELVQTGTGYRISVSGVKGLRCGVDHPPPRNSEVKRSSRAIPTLLGLHGSLYGTQIKFVVVDNIHINF